MGQVAGVARGHNGSVWAFHRAERVWGPDSFGADDRFTEEQPISEAVMLELDQDTGAGSASYKTLYRGGASSQAPCVVPKRSYSRDL